MHASARPNLAAPPGPVASPRRRAHRLRKTPSTTIRAVAAAVRPVAVAATRGVPPARHAMPAISPPSKQVLERYGIIFRVICRYQQILPILQILGELALGGGGRLALGCIEANCCKRIMLTMFYFYF